MFLDMILTRGPKLVLSASVCAVGDFTIALWGHYIHHCRVGGGATGSRASWWGCRVVKSNFS